MPPTEPVLRRMTLADAAEGATLAGRVGWSHSVAAWERFVTWSGEGAFCITVDGQIIVTAFATIYSQRLAWIGSVVTDPAYQGRGLARKMMAHVMDYLAAYKVESVMLDASEKGYPLYDKLGFHSLYKIEVWAGQPSPEVSATPSEPLTESCLPDVVRLDAKWNGVLRTEVIHRMWQPGAAWISQENGQLAGYLLAQTDSRGVHVGPWYHHSPDGAKQLLQTAVNAFPGQTLRVQFPEPNAAARSLAVQYALTPSRSCTRMVYGEKPPGNMIVQYGIAAFATG